MTKKQTETSKKKFIKPEIIVKELSLHALLGENGWFQNSFSRPVLAATYIPY